MAQHMENKRFFKLKKNTEKKLSKMLDKDILAALILPDPQNQGVSEIGAEIRGLGRHYSVGNCPN